MSLPLPDRLATSRLELRVWRPGDTPELHEALEESVRHLVGWIPWASSRAPTPAETRALVEGWIREHRSGENVIWAIRDGSGRLVGGIGVYDRVGPGVLEIGYWVRATAVGRGFCTEAARAVVDVAFALPGVRRLELHMDRDNGPSRRVAEKLGFRRREGGSGPADGAENRIVIHERTAPG